jgi:hypothetical protein
MSILTDAIIVTMFSDDDGMAQVNKYLYECDHPSKGGRGQQFEKMSNEYTGGNKSSSMTVYQACFNHMLATDIEDAFNNAEFKYGNCLLIIDDEITGYQVHRQGEKLLQGTDGLW